MDKLHREHDFVQKMWKFMKWAETNHAETEEFWAKTEEYAAKLEHDYDNMSFVPDWIASYLKFLDQEAAS